MDSKTTYFSNTFYKNKTRDSCDVYKITNYDNSFNVVRYFPDNTKLEIKVPNKRVPYTDTWLMYSPNKGLFLNSFFVGPNVLGFSEDDYETIFCLGAYPMVEEIDIGNSIEQGLSDGEIKFEDEKISIKGNFGMHNINKKIVFEGTILITTGCFIKLFAEKYSTLGEKLGVKHVTTTPYYGEVICEIGAELGENASINVTSRKNIKYQYKGKDFATSVSKQNGELIYT